MSTYSVTEIVTQVASPPTSRPKPVSKPTKFGLKRKQSYDDLEHPGVTESPGGGGTQFVSEPLGMSEPELEQSPAGSTKRQSGARSSLSSWFNGSSKSSETRGLEVRVQELGLENQILKESNQSLTSRVEGLEEENQRLTAEVSKKREEWEGEKLRLRAALAASTEQLKTLQTKLDEAALASPTSGIIIN